MRGNGNESIAEMADCCSECHRAAMLRLAHVLASADDVALHATYSAAIASTPIALASISSTAVPSRPSPPTAKQPPEPLLGVIPPQPQREPVMRHERPQIVIGWIAPRARPQ
ncbi:hypothetical protein [Actinomadura meridiana]|uniref:hypothetical protein n=1 Tax=Actinomadura meridiana TaxID=559626 RepID=UPI0031EDA956